MYNYLSIRLSRPHSEHMPHLGHGIPYVPAKEEHDEADHVARFFKEIDDRCDSIFTTIVRRIGHLLQGRAEERGYGHPEFLKTVAGWQHVGTRMGRPFCSDNLSAPEVLHPYLQPAE